MEQKKKTIYKINNKVVKPPKTSRRINVKANEKITAEWLKKQHPELTIKDAKKLKLFCEQHTIKLKGCYGNGSIMYPKWLNYINPKIDKITEKLTTDIALSVVNINFEIKKIILNINLLKKILL